MTDASHSTDETSDVGISTQTTRNVLFKRNPHFRSSEMSSPAGFGGLGTRQFLQKQLMTPGSATSASSFEEGASYDGFSDAGTPDVQLSSLEKANRLVAKQPTKRLSSPSRESLARRLMVTTTEIENTSDTREELPRSEIFSNLVVKTVPDMAPATKTTRTIVASPTTKTMRRVVVRTIGTDGQEHEEVQFVDVAGNVVDGGVPTSTSSTSSMSTRRVVTPPKLRKRTLRRTGADGKVHQQVQYLDTDGNIVRTEGDDFSTIESVSSSSTGTLMTRTIVTPGKTIRRIIVRKTGADGQIHEEVQYMDADGKIVQNDGSESFISDAPLSSGSERTVVTQKLKRVLIRRKGVNGEVVEEEQYVDADGNVVTTEDKSQRKVTRSIQRMIQKDGTRVPVEQYVDLIESEHGTLHRTDSFNSVASDTSSSSRRMITRRVVSAPARRSVVYKTGSVSGAESEDEALYVDTESGLTTSLTATSQSSGGRRITRVVTPQRVVRRMANRKKTATSGLEIDALHSEENTSSDDSLGGSSRRLSVSDRIMIPRVVSSSVTTSNEPIYGTHISTTTNTTVGTVNDEEIVGITLEKDVIYSESTVEELSVQSVHDDEVETFQKSMEGSVELEMKEKMVVETTTVTLSTEEDSEISTDQLDVPVVIYTATTMALVSPECEPAEQDPNDVTTSVIEEDEEKDCKAHDAVPIDVNATASLSNINRDSNALSDAQDDVPGAENNLEKSKEKTAVFTIEDGRDVSTSQTELDVLQTVVDGAAVVTSVEIENPNVDPIQSDGAELVVEEVDTVTILPSSSHPDVSVVQTTVTTTTELELESLSKTPHRKTGRSIWKFWGADTLNRPTIDTEEEEHDHNLVHSPTLSTENEAQEIPLSTEAEDGVVVTEITQTTATVEELELEPSHTVNTAELATVSDKLVRESERRTTMLIDGTEPEFELDEHYVQIASPRYNDTVIEEEEAVTPCSLAWKNLRLNGKNGVNEAVLNDVSGSVKAREFLVITGPSKDESLALLSCLAGYQDEMEGNVTVNGRQWNQTMNRYIAYITREDLFYETLTVYEHLVFQAQLRMGRSHTKELCLSRVERVLNDMDLSSCRDQLIGGSSSIQGITRGERKLVAIATSLLTNPSILLVDEPTDEMDTFSAEKIVSKLRWLAFEKGLTVVVTLHHPSSHFYGLFDVLYLVADASCIYNGKASDCVAYFSTLGYHCPAFMSPLDYFLLQMATGDCTSDKEGVLRVERLKKEWVARSVAVDSENAFTMENYDQKNSYRHMSCCGQLWLLWTRQIRSLSRYGFVFWWHLLTALLIGVVFGLIYLQLDLNDQQGIQNFSGAFFYLIILQLLFISYRTFVFLPRETAIALRERQEYRGDWYQFLCWYLTKFMAELPALVLLSIALFVPVFLLMGIGHGFKVYFYMQLVIILTGWTAIGLAFLTLGVLTHVTLAVMVYAVLLALFVAFGGLFINMKDIPDWLLWLHYISPVKYSYEALMKLFWKRVDSIDCDWTLEGCVALTGDGVLKYYSMEKRSALGDSLLLLAICLALFFAAFWFLLALASKRVSGLEWHYNWSFKGLFGRRQQRIENASVSGKQGANQSTNERFKDLKSPSADTENYYIHVETPRAGGRGFNTTNMTLSWRNLWVESTKMVEKKSYLLQDASGSTNSGELLLVTGPSNASNVTLLECLGGLKKMKGIITLNGVPSSAQKVAQCTEFVPRDDLFYETLTVAQHLQFQAQILSTKSSGRCGFYCGNTELECVEMALEELELSTQRNVSIRYLSKVDLKLLAIATSLLTNPSILLLEEPTCGMDFYSSQRLVLKLRQLARGGRTIVVTMKHPSSHLYALFDTLYLLADGAAVYYGQVKKAVPYFASLGYQCPQYMSPVDFFIRQVSSSTNDSEIAPGQVKFFKETWSNHYSEGDNQVLEVQEEEINHRQRINCCNQLSLLIQRHILHLSGYNFVFGWHSLWMILLGVIIGLIFLQLDLNDQQDIQNWAGAFFFLIVLQMFVMMYRTFVFLPREMAIAEREYRTGRYFMSCWFLTKVFIELPATLILSVLLFVPAYFLIGIGHGFELYFYMQIVMWLVGWSAVGIATLLLGLFRRIRVALIINSVLLLLFVVFGGFLSNVDDIPDYFIWLHYISPVKYSYEALMKLFWGRIVFLTCGETDGSGSGSATFATVGDDYSFSMSGSGSYQDDCIAHSGDEVLSHYNMKNSRTARSDSFILLELTVLYFFIGYAFLSLRWRRYKTQQRQS